MQRMCHEFDMNFGGSWGSNSIIPAENKVILRDLKALEKTEMRLKEWRITKPAL